MSSLNEYELLGLIHTGEQSAIFIPRPSLPTGKAARSYMTSFNQLADSPPPADVAPIKDMEAFTRSLGLPEDAEKVELFIKAPGTGFYIPPKLAQFTPEIRNMIAYYYNRHNDDGYCAFAVHQAIMKPKTGAGAFYDAHKDITLSRIRNEGRAPHAFGFAASDTLMTGFSDYKLSTDDLAKIHASDDPDETMHDILNGPNVVYKGRKPGMITAFETNAVHAFANPPTPTQRTVILSAFRPADAHPKELHNPWLEKVMQGKYGHIPWIR